MRRGPDDDRCDAGSPLVVLSIAGSDSGGGAGIQADLRTFAALGVFGTTAVTAVTAQNTVGVRSVHVLPSHAVVEQIEAVLDDVPVAAVKTGMLADARTVRAVADLARAGRLPNLVVDPVMVASSGAILASEEAVDDYRAALLPLAQVVTPNVPEAVVLAGRRLASADQACLARVIGEASGAAVVVKGGHGHGEQVEDVLWHRGRTARFARARVPTVNTHGSGCSFAAAVAVGLARGDGIEHAVVGAGEFVHRAIQGAAGWRLGAGPGPLDHFGWGSAP